MANTKQVRALELLPGNVIHLDGLRWRVVRVNATSVSVAGIKEYDVEVGIEGPLGDYAGAFINGKLEPIPLARYMRVMAESVDDMFEVD